MSEAILAKLETSTVFLGQLLQEGHLDPAYVAKAIEKRRRHEFSIKGRAALVEHFLDYLDFETSLYRDVEGQVKGSKGGHKYLTAQKKCVFSVFERALSRFPKRADLWLKYIDFASEVGAGNVASRAIGKALQLNPSHEALLCHAVHWEHFFRRNIPAARALAMKFLRDHPRSFAIWSKYLAIEIDYAKTVRERQKALGIADTECLDAESARIKDIVAGALPTIILKRASVELSSADVDALKMQAQIEGAELALLADHLLANK